MFGAIMAGVSKALGIAENITRKSQEGQLIDAGEAKGLATTLEAVHGQLEEMRAARDRFDSDDDFREWVFKQVTEADDG